MDIKIDLTYLENMSAGDNNLIKELIEIFIEQVPEFITEMNNAIKNNDSKVLSSVAHKAKSSVAIVGIVDLAEELKILENISANGERSNEYQDFVDRFTIISNESIKLLTEISLKL